MSLDYKKALRMARHMKAHNEDIVAAIEKVTEAQHGVVALRFTQEAKYMEIEILDEPFDPNVKVFG